MGLNNQTGKMICSILMFSMLCGIALASTAMAGNCVYTEKSGPGLKAKKAKVRIKNNTDMTFSVRYLRDGNLKNTLELSPGDKDHQNFGISTAITSSSKDVLVKLEMDTGATTAAAVCSFQIGNFQLRGGEATFFTPYDCKTASLVNLCATCTIACQKSWNSSDKYWNVKYTINQ